MKQKPPVDKVLFVVAVPRESQRQYTPVDRKIADYVIDHGAT